MLTPMTEDISSVIAIVAALVAALSALYARWQAKAARRANEISLHANRLAVFTGLARFRVHVTARGTGISEEEVWRFAEIAELSEFYFPSAVHPKMSAVYEQSLKLLSLNDEWEHARQHEPEKAKALVGPRHELVRNTRDECYKITDELKKHLRIGGV